MNYVYVNLMLGFLAEIELKRDQMQVYYKEALVKAHITLPEENPIRIMIDKFIN